ncbi:MAG: hypothetical protein K6D98_05870 [Clostridiales bacterium]|nr:hypothetical protein [Clostridiales bacterium]
MMEEFKSGFGKLKQKHFDFLTEEFGFSKENIEEFTDEEMNDKIYEPLCDIETSETPTDDSPLPERCKLVSEIVTTLGNSIAKFNGWLDEE